MQIPSLSPLMRIGELSDRSQVPIKTIRYYEELGLIESANRTAGGFRQFSPSSLTRLGFIKQAKVLGLSLDEIHHILNIHDRGEMPCQEVKQTLQGKIADIEQRIQELSRLKDHLTQLLVEADSPTQPAAAICPIIEQGNPSRPLGTPAEEGRMPNLPSSGR